MSHVRESVYSFTYMMNAPQYTHRESVFRRYESAIAEIVSKWPKPVIFEPTRSCETFSCRLRDAIASLRNNQWQTTIPMAPFLQICDEITVSTSVVPGKVAVGPYDALRGMRDRTLAGTPISAGYPETTAVNNITLADDETTVRAVLHLLHEGALSGPFTIRP